MKIIANIFLASVFYIFASCSTSRLTDQDIALNPYRENDVLVFRNKFDDYDTVFITKVERIENPVDPLSAFSDRTETLVVIARHSDPDAKHGYISGSFLTLSRTKDSLYISFDLGLKDSEFYDPLYNINDVRDVTLQTISAFDRTYADVIKVISTNTEYKTRDNFIRSFYWDAEYGYVKVERLNNGYWYLVQRIRSKNSNK